MPDTPAKPKTKSPRRIWLRRAFRFLALFLALGLITLIADGWRAFGHRPTGARRIRMENSAQWAGSQFENPQPLWNDLWGALIGGWNTSPHGRPAQALPTLSPGPIPFETLPKSGLRVTWLGHSSILIELDGHYLLSDPVWSERVSPFTWVGPQRWYAPPIPLEDLPALDAVLISHDHYDHLDYPTISAMKDWKTTFFVPLGVAEHLVYWGVPEERIVELDWWERARLRDLEVVCVPARHASGRTMYDNNRTLWAGYALLGQKHRVYFSGDTGLFPALRDIGERLGPFDLTMIEVGAYHKTWPDWHLGPEQAVEAHGMVRGRAMLPIHWGLFNLAFHAWTEPAERVVEAARKAGVQVLMPKPGESVEPETAPAMQKWWPEVPWVKGEQDPIRATKMNEK